MKYGEKYLFTTKTYNGKPFTTNRTYMYAEWGDYHTNDFGTGLWRGTKQILGTCQFGVTGCKTEKTAKAKIRNFVKKWYGHIEEL